jgi:NADPH2:quinone reductase
MKAAHITATGPASVIQYGDVPEPTLQPGQILVRTAAVAVNPIDTYIRGGLVALELPVPYVIGCDVAGTVEAIGSEVTRFAVGDRVWASNQGLFGRQGTFSELVAVDQDWAYPTPDGVTDAAAAAGSLTGITAHLGLHLHAGIQAGETVFVNGGTGGVGSAVVQLAKAAGATVITTAGSEEKLQQAKTLGADFVFNYHDDFEDALKQAAAEQGGINIWFETLRSPTLDRTIGLMAKRGRVVLMAGRDARPEFPVGPFYVNDLRAIGFAMFNASAEEQRAAAEDLNQALQSGAYQPIIGAEFPLSQAADAHQLQEDNTLAGAGTLAGKIILKP